MNFNELIITRQSCRKYDPTRSVEKEKLDKLVLSKQTLSANGGLVLRCGNIEANCSLSLLFAQLREELEAEVSHALFVTERQQ